VVSSWLACLYGQLAYRLH